MNFCREVVQIILCRLPAVSRLYIILVVGKKSKNVFDFLIYVEQKGISISYLEIGEQTGLNEPSNGIYRVST